MAAPPPPDVFDTYSENKQPNAWPDALTYLKDLLTNPNLEWVSNGNQMGIELQTYQPEPPLPAPITRGTGFFPAGLTAEQILPVIHQHACRKHWDDRFQTGYPTLRYSRKLVRFYAVQKGVGEGWFTVVSPRDFTGYSGHAKEVGEDGVTRYYYLQTSAEFADVPSYDGFVRGETTVAGWVLEEKAGEPVKCTYTVRFDPKGSIPHSLLSQIATNAPLCIARVSNFIQENGIIPYVRMHDDFPGQLRQEAVAEVGGENGVGDFQLSFSWFGAPGSFDIHFNDKWGDSVKVDVEEGADDLDIAKAAGKATITVKGSGEGKKLKVVLSKV